MTDTHEDASLAREGERIAHTKRRVHEIVHEEKDGFWKSCSGCFETSDGYNVNGYTDSPVYECLVGSGCGECGGIGVVWDDTDYEDMAQFTRDWDTELGQARTTLAAQDERIAVLEGALRTCAARLGGLMGEDASITVGIGGNPNYVDGHIIPECIAAIDAARAALSSDTQPSTGMREDG